MEQRRGCGWRKIGATYLMGSGFSMACGRLPFPLHVCPTCNGGIKQSRGWTWIQPAALFANLPACRRASHCICPMSDPARLADAKGRCGLIWIGTQFYPTPADFTGEAARMGVCRRVAAIPKGIEPGKTWVVLAHPKAIPVNVDTLTEAERDELNLDADTTFIHRPGVFSVFQLTAIERCVSEADFADTEAMDKLRAKGITPVALPDDPRHRGSVYDEDEQTDLPLEAA